MDQENGPIDTQKSTLTIHVGKTGAFSALEHEHEVRAPIHGGVADTGSHPTVAVRVDARAGRKDLNLRPCGPEQWIKSPKSLSWRQLRFFELLSVRQFGQVPLDLLPCPLWLHSQRQPCG